MSRPRFAAIDSKAVSTRPTFVYDAARGLGHRQGIFVAGIENISAYQCAAHIGPRGHERAAELPQERRGIAGRFAA